MKKKKKDDSDEIRTRAGCPSRFRVYRLNHSATLSNVNTLCRRKRLFSIYTCTL